MKIAIIKESLCLGGTERSASNISQALAQGHQVYTILFDEKNIQYPYGGQLIGLSLPPRAGLIGKVWNSFLRSRRVKKELRKHDIDTAYIFTSVSGYMMHDRLRNCKKIISCRDFGKLKRQTKSFAHALHNSDAIVFNSKYQRDFYVSNYPHDAEKCFCSYNIIAQEQIRQQAEQPVEPGFTEFLGRHRINLAAVGRYCAEKGFEHLLASFCSAASRDPSLGLVLIGDGALRGSYEAFIKEHGLSDRVYMTGFQQNPYSYMARCDIFVLSSVSEGFPNVVPEAMACGLPVICANCLTGPAEILNREAEYDLAAERYVRCDYGILTPGFGAGIRQDQKAEEQLAEAILYLAQNREERENLQAAGAVRVRDFSQAAARKELERVLQKIHGQKEL